MAGLASGSALVLTFGALSSCDGAPPSKSGSDEEWMTTASGLQIQELSPGNGDPAKKGQTVFVHYTGYIMSPNGWEIFDSSRARNEPLEFPLGARCVRCCVGSSCIVGAIDGTHLLFLDLIPPHLTVIQSRQHGHLWLG